MRRTLALLVVGVLFFELATAYLTPPEEVFAVEVLLNKPDITYDLSILENAKNVIKIEPTLNSETKVTITKARGECGVDDICFADIELEKKELNTNLTEFKGWEIKYGVEETKYGKVTVVLASKEGINISVAVEREDEDEKEETHIHMHGKGIKAKKSEIVELLKALMPLSDVEVKKIEEAIDHARVVEEEVMEEKSPLPPSKKAYIYKSHYRDDLAVILYEDNIMTKDDKIRGPYLAIRIQPKIETKSVPFLRSRITVKLSYRLPNKNPRVEGWEIGGGEAKNVTIGNKEYAYYRIRAGYVERSGMLLKHIDIMIFPEFKVEHGNKETNEDIVSSYTVIEIYSEGFDPREMSDEIIKAVKAIIPLSNEEEEELRKAIENAKVEEVTRDIPYANFDDRDAKEALKRELEWLLSVGIIKGLTKEDIEEITKLAHPGAAGYNMRILWWKKWTYMKDAAEGGAYILLRGRNAESGFSLREIEIPTEDVIITQVSVIQEPKSVKREIVILIIAIAIGAGVLAWKWRK